MKIILSFFFIFISAFNFQAQETKYPRFESCENINSNLSEKQCFESTFLSTLKSELVAQEDYNKINNEKVSLIFEVDNTGKFGLIFIESNDTLSRPLLENAFNKLPTVKPAVAYGNPTYMQFNLAIDIPLQSTENYNFVQNETTKSLDRAKKEFDSIDKQSYKYDGELYSSSAFVPLSHEIYNRFDREVNLIGTNTHTAQKPYSYEDVKKYYSFKKENEKLSFNQKSWFGKKLFDEHLATVSSDNYWFAVDFGVDLQLGKDTDNDLNTYNNTRIGYVQGGIGEKFTFYGAIFESQGRFADYFNRLGLSRAPADGYPAVVPSRGVAKPFGEGGFDYPVTVGYLNYRANDNFNFQIGNHKNFIGDGYRSLFLSDNASPIPFVKVDAKFWKIKN